METRTFQREGQHLTVVRTALAAHSEGQALRDWLADQEFDHVAYTLSSAEVDAIPMMRGMDPDGVEPPTEEMAHYLEQLATIDRVRLAPSPDLDVLNLWATEHGAPEVGLDWDDDAHTDAFTKAVGTLGLVQLSRARKAQRKQTCAPGTTAQQWAETFEAPLQATKAQSRWEHARCQHILEGLAALEGRVLLHVTAGTLPMLEDVLA